MQHINRRKLAINQSVHFTNVKSVNNSSLIFLTGNLIIWYIPFLLYWPVNNARVPKKKIMISLVSIRGGNSYFIILPCIFRLNLKTEILYVIAILYISEIMLFWFLMLHPNEVSQIKTTLSYKLCTPSMLNQRALGSLHFPVISLEVR